MNIDNQKIHEYFYNEEEEENIQKVSVGSGIFGIVFNSILALIFLIVICYIIYIIVNAKTLNKDIKNIIFIFIFSVIGLALSASMITHKDKNNISDLSFWAGIFTGINIIMLKGGILDIKKLFELKNPITTTEQTANKVNQTANVENKQQ